MRRSSRPHLSPTRRGSAPSAPLHRPPRWRAAALAAVLAGLAVATTSPALTGRAGAAVVHRQGFEATVLGWTSWYGSYEVAGIGTAWCVDHGIAAPDTDHGYEPAVLAERAPETTRAMAWALGAHGGTTDQVEAAALMLVLHDLMGARYPNGTLAVDALRLADLAGFDGREGDVLARARAIRTEAIARSHLQGPLVLTATAPPVEPGASGTLTVAVRDAAGAPVARIDVAVAVTGAVLLQTPVAATGTDGTAVLTFEAVEGDNTFSASADVPSLTLDSFAPTRRPAQRIGRPSLQALDATASFTAVPTGTLQIAKVGDAEPFLPVDGARFEVRPAGTDGIPTAVLEVRADGTAPIVTLPAGRYVVDEVRPPVGYLPSGPWDVEVPARGTATLRMVNTAKRGRLLVSKVDAVTSETVAGATLEVARDTSGDGSYGEVVTTVTSSTEPVAVEDLLPGRYRVTESSAPPGYALADGPTDLEVGPGATVEVAVADAPLASLAFAKEPDGPHDPSALWLAGATFVVRDPGGVEVGRCTTDADGRCALPPLSLRGGAQHCWEELTAPPGWGLAPPGCATTGGAGSVTTVAVQEPSTHGQVGGMKVDAQDGMPLGGAVYDLYREVLVSTEAVSPPAPPPPAGATVLAGHEWVAAATSDPDGTLTWPPQVPGHRYCAVERTAPAGYELDPTPVCTDVLGDSATVSLRLEDHATALPAVEAVPVEAVDVLAGPPATSTPRGPTALLGVRAVPPRTPTASLPRTGAGSVALLQAAGAVLVLGGTASLTGDALATRGARRGRPIRDRRQALG